MYINKALILNIEIVGATYSAKENRRFNAVPVNYQLVCFDATTIFSFPSHTFEHTPQQVSSPHPFLSVPISHLQASNSRSTKKKIDLWPQLQPGYHFFHIRTQHIGSLLSKLVLQKCRLRPALFSQYTPLPSINLNPLVFPIYPGCHFSLRTQHRDTFQSKLGIFTSL